MTFVDDALECLAALHFFAGDVVTIVARTGHACPSRYVLVQNLIAINYSVCVKPGLGEDVLPQYFRCSYPSFCWLLFVKP